MTCRQQLKEYFEHTQRSSNLILEKLTAQLQQRQRTVEASMVQFTDLVARHHQLQQAEAEVRPTKHEQRRADQQLADAEDRRDIAADRLDQFRRAVTSAQTVLETKTANYHKATDMLKTHMGIEVRRRSASTAAAEPGTVVRVITLTRLDERDPERPFHVQYTVCGSRVTPVSTKPSLGDLSELQEELDQTGNLGLCMVTLRGRFQQLARQQAEQRERRATRAAARAARAAAAAAGRD